MKNSKLLVSAAVLSLFVLLAASGVRADSIYNFDSMTVGTQTTFSVTSNGITATFSSLSDPGGFGVGPTFFSAPMTGNVLLDPGSAGVGSIVMEISFSSNVTSINMDFAVNGTPSDTFGLSAFEGLTLIGSNSASGVVLSSFPQGSISFGGSAFNTVFLSSTAPDFAIDNVDVVGASATPEPPTGLLLGTSLLALLGAFRRQHLA